MIKVTLQLSRGHLSTYIPHIGDISYLNSCHQVTVVWSPLLALAASVVYPSGEKFFVSSLIFSFLSGWRRQWLIAFDDLRRELRSTSTTNNAAYRGEYIIPPHSIINRQYNDGWPNTRFFKIHYSANSASIWGIPGNKSQKKEITVEKFSLN
jgi:hypothetical protein